VLHKHEITEVRTVNQQRRRERGIAWRYWEHLICDEWDYQRLITSIPTRSNTGMSDGWQTGLFKLTRPWQWSICRRLVRRTGAGR
jgi:hypothetical protein